MHKGKSILQGNYVQPDTEKAIAQRVTLSYQAQSREHHQLEASRIGQNPVPDLGAEPELPEGLRVNKDFPGKLSEHGS